MRNDLKFNFVKGRLPTEEAQRLYAQDMSMLMATSALVSAMDRAGVTRAEVAKRIDRSPGFVSQVLNGSRNMTLKTFADFAWAMGLEVGRIELKPLGEMTVSRGIVEAWFEGAQQVTVTAGSASTVRESVPVGEGHASLTIAA